MAEGKRLSCVCLPRRNIARGLPLGSCRMEAGEEPSLLGDCNNITIHNWTTRRRTNYTEKRQSL